MHAEVAWVLVSPGTQVQLQIILDIDYLPDYLSVSYHYVLSKLGLLTLVINLVLIPSDQNLSISFFANLLRTTEIT